MIYGVKSLKKVFSSATTMAILLMIFAAALGAATFVEHAYSTQVAMETIYKSWWIFTLEALLVLNFVAMSIRRHLWRERRWGLLLLHYGFVAILVGAMTTYLTGVEGIVHIRQGEPEWP